MDASYGQEEECLVKGRGELGGAYIVRLPCGPTHQVMLGAEGGAMQWVGGRLLRGSTHLA